MILLIDNYDSFTFNLYQALSELGAEVVVRRNDQITVDEVEQLVPSSTASWFRRAVYAGRGRYLGSAGAAARRQGADPRRLPGASVDRRCVWREIVRAPRLMHGKTSMIHHDGAGVFAGLPNPFTPPDITR